MRTTLHALRASQFQATYLEVPRQVEQTYWNNLVTRAEGSLEVGEALLGLPASTAPILSLSDHAAFVLLQLCKAECCDSEHTVQDVDFFFADLDAKPPKLDRLSPEAREAWDVFLEAVDVSGTTRSALPWWLDRAARYRCAFAGLLSPDKVKRIHQSMDELRDWMKREMPDAASDGFALLHMIETAAQDGHWILGWEPGT